MKLSFQELYESHAAQVYRFAYALTGDRDEAQDITSETFVRAWAKNATIRTETLKAYLFTIVRNIHVEWQRKNRRYVALPESLPDPATGADKRLEYRIGLEKLSRVLETLPEIDRAAFIMRVQHELAYDEIARVLGISLAAAKVKVHRVRRKLLSGFLEKEV